MTRQEILSNVFFQLRNAGFVYNKGDFARRLHYDPSHMSSIFSGSRKISNKVFNRILEVFPPVNELYLRTGVGFVLNASGPRNAAETLHTSQYDASLMATLLAEREAIRQNLDTLDRMIALISPRDMKSAS